MANNSSEVAVGYKVNPLVIYASLFSAICLWVLISNALVILAIWRTAKLQNKTGLFIASLACADLLCGILVMPSWLLGLFATPTVNGHLVCGVYISMQVLPLMASISNLVLITFERYLAIVHPLTRKGIMTKRRCWQLVILAWVIPLCASAVCIPWNDYPGKGPCTSRHMAKYYFFSIIYVSFWGMLFLMIYWYGCILKRTHGHHRFVRKHSVEASHGSGISQSRERKRIRADTQLAKLVLLVMGVFCLC